MVIFKALWLLVFGLCVGSFINCLVYRLNHGLSVKRGRSFCPACRHQLAWYDNLPLFSFVWLKGHCRYCHSPIGIHYPLVELAGGLLTILILNSQFSIFNLLIAYALLAIFISDWLYQTIPDQIVFPAMGLVIIYLILNSQFSILNFLLAGFGAAGFFWLLVLITKGKGMGLGDVKLAGLMGLLLGWPKIVLAINLAFLTGAMVGVILVLMGQKTRRSQIAFGPFLVAATFISLFWGERILKIWGY